MASKKNKVWWFSKFIKKELAIRVLLIAVIAFLFISGGVILWVATLKIPDIQSLHNKVLAGSTKIYDKTGETLLYDLNKDARQQVVPYADISQNVKNATIAIEDDKFYQHKGIEVTSIVRAILANLATLHFSQGGSTITQQVIKNSLLTTDKKISRKIKEWVLALKLERVMSKDDILNLYLNGTSYGGSYYGIEEASKNFLGKSAKDVNVTEAAYLAALPQAPTTYSPFGNHTDLLEARKNLVLLKMKENGYITEEQYTAAKNEKVTFKKQETHNIKAPHFVMFIREYLIQKYGEDMVKNGNLKVITTLDYEMQQKAEEVVKEYALSNEKKFNASNAALTAIDPTNGQILVMVGSRDYFDPKIDGNFNVVLADRQPGSSFKPFAYVTAFKKGYTPDTVLFDVPTQFSTTCDAYGTPLSAGASCYKPQNYDGKFLGPVSIRNALAQSRNIPAIKTLYLVGIKDTIQTAQDLGITSLGTPNQYGLTLVLGGGEVSPLEMTSAYSVFANNGVRNPSTGILSITDRDGKILEEFKADPKQVIDEQNALLINDVLHDNSARLPLNGSGSATDFPNREVALKTGTTNDERDTWIIGYTPHIAVGAWAGNNDNSPMGKKGSSGLIVSPMWRAFMDKILPDLPVEQFARPNPTDPNLKPILRGIWQGGQTYTIDTSSGKLATDLTPPENRREQAVPDVHSILYWVDKSNPTGPPPAHPENDPQYNLWEPTVRAWATTNGGSIGGPAPTQSDDVHTPDAAPVITITSPSQNTQVQKSDTINVTANYQNKFQLKKVEFYVNNFLIGTASSQPFMYSFAASSIQNPGGSNSLKVVAYDIYDNRGESSIQFGVK